MMATQLALREPSPVTALFSPQEEATRLKIFREIPRYHHEVAVLLGMVVVYETDSLFRDSVQDGGLYVTESQYPVAGMRWESWLRYEVEDEDRHRRAQPRSPLKTSRTVVKAVRCPSGKDLWWLRLPSGFSDGPIHGWSIGHNFVGKVVGIYAPEAPQ